MNYLLATLALSLAACATVDIPQPTLLDSQRTGIALADLAHGRALYLDKCTKCHTAVGPREHAPAAWPHLVADMAERAMLQPPEHELILNYLVTAAASAAPAR